MKNFKSKWGALIILLVLSVGIVAIFYFDNESNSKNYSDNKKTQNNGDKIIQNYTISYLNEKITDRFNEMSHVVTLYNDIKLEEDNNKEDELIVSVNYISPKNYSIEEIGKLTITNLNNIKKDWTFDKYISKYIINYYSSGISKYTIEHENNSRTSVDKIIIKNNITDEVLEIDNATSNSDSMTTDKSQVNITNDSSSNNSSNQNNTNKNNNSTNNSNNNSNNGNNSNNNSNSNSTNNSAPVPSQVPESTSNTSIYVSKQNALDKAKSYTLLNLKDTKNANNIDNSSSIKEKSKTEKNGK